MVARNDGPDGAAVWLMSIYVFSRDKFFFFLCTSYSLLRFIYNNYSDGDVIVSIYDALAPPGWIVPSPLPQKVPLTVATLPTSIYGRSPFPLPQFCFFHLLSPFNCLEIVSFPRFSSRPFSLFFFIF